MKTLGAIMMVAVMTVVQLSAYAEEVPKTTNSTVDVVVVGAGYSGLVAARRVTAAGKRVLVFEANDYAGGRTLNFDIRSVRPGVNGIIELGGEWLNERNQQPHAWGLIVDELGFKAVHNTESTGTDFLFSEKAPAGTKIDPSSWKFLWRVISGQIFSWEVILEMRWYSSEMTRLYKALPANRDKLDNMTMQAWMDSNLEHQGTRDLVRWMILGLNNREPADHSFLSIVTSLRGQIVQSLRDGIEYRLEGGTQAPAEKMRAELGASVRLSTPVTNILQDARGVQVIVSSGEIIRAKHVIFTGTPWTSNKITWSPPLPSPKKRLFDKLSTMGNCVKMSVFYDTPFWRQQNSSGQVIGTVEVDGLFFPACLDNSPLNSSVGVMQCITAGNTSTTLMKLSKSARQDAMVKYLARALGDQALTPFHYEDKDWVASPYIGGGVYPILAPGVLTHDYAALASDFGHVTWAGADTLPLDAHNFGFIDGAIQTGEMAAQRVLKSFDEAVLSV